MNAEERKIVSYHEVGHALISALQKNSEPVQKITIVPRTMGALGYVMNVPEEEKFLNSEAELLDMLVSLVGGRAAEEIVFDTVTTGAANDIEKATSVARAMVTQYGMSKKFGLIGLETVESKYLEGRSALNCSDVTAAEIDLEVMKLLKDSYKEAKKLLKANRKLMDKLAAHLIEKETITGKEFMKIYRKDKGIPEPKEDKKIEKQTAGGSLPVNGVHETDAGEVDAGEIDTERTDSEDSVIAMDEQEVETEPSVVEETYKPAPKEDPAQDEEKPAQDEELAKNESQEFADTLRFKLYRDSLNAAAKDLDDSTKNSVK